VASVRKRVARHCILLPLQLPATFVLSSSNTTSFGESEITVIPQPYSSDGLVSTYFRAMITSWYRFGQPLSLVE